MRPSLGGLDRKERGDRRLEASATGSNGRVSKQQTGPSGQNPCGPVRLAKMDRDTSRALFAGVKPAGAGSGESRSPPARHAVVCHWETPWGDFRYSVFLVVKFEQFVFSILHSPDQLFEFAFELVYPALEIAVAGNQNVPFALHTG